jgi:hypothetical protein
MDCVKMRKTTGSRHRVGRRLAVPEGCRGTLERERLDPRTVPAPRGRAAGGRAGKPIDCLWLSKIAGRTVGMVRLVGTEQRAVRLSLFHIDPEWQHTAIVANLLQYVHDFCCERGCGTLQLAPRVAPQWVPGFIAGRGFRPLRRRLISGQDMLEFRVDFGYRRVTREPCAASL